MKIDPSQELLKTQHTDKPSAAQKPDKDEFSAMLKEAIEKSVTFFRIRLYGCNHMKLLQMK